MIIYKGQKDLCYVKSIEIKDNITKVETGFKLLPEPSYFYKNFLGVTIEIATGAPQISKTEAWEYVEHRAKLNKENFSNITCPFLNPERLIPVENVNRKEFKKRRNEIKKGKYNI